MHFIAKKLYTYFWTLLQVFLHNFTKNKTENLNFQSLTACILRKWECYLAKILLIFIQLIIYFNQLFVYYLINANKISRHLVEISLTRHDLTRICCTQLFVYGWKVYLLNSDVCLHYQLFIYVFCWLFTFGQLFVYLSAFALSKLGKCP